MNDLHKLIKRAGFHFSEGEMVSWGRNVILPSLIIRCLRLIECPGGIAREYACRMESEKSWMDISHFFENELSTVPNEVGQGILHEVMTEAGFEFEVGDLVKFKNNREPRMPESSVIITNRILEQSAGIVQRFYMIRVFGSYGESISTRAQISEIILQKIENNE